MNLATALHIFSNVQGNKIVGMDTETVVPLKGGKKNPMQGHVTKRTMGIVGQCAGNVKSNFYENQVNRRLEAEGKAATFEVGARAWGEKETGTALVFHDNGEVYVHIDNIQSVGEVTYYLKGVLIDKKDVTGLPDKPKANPQGQGGLSEDNRTVPRTYKLASILAVRYGGQEYR